MKIKRSLLLLAVMALAYACGQPFDLVDNRTQDYLSMDVTNQFALGPAGAKVVPVTIKVGDHIAHADVVAKTVILTATFSDLACKAALKPPVAHHRRVLKQGHTWHSVWDIEFQTNVIVNPAPAETCLATLDYGVDFDPYIARKSQEITINLH